METSKELIAGRFSGAQATYDHHALAQKKIAARLCDLIVEFIDKEQVPKSMFEIGCGTGLLTRMLLSRFPFRTVHLNDISEAFIPFFTDLEPRHEYSFYPAANEPNSASPIIHCGKFETSLRKTY